MATTSSSSGASSTQYTLTALNRWSVANQTLPPIDSIKTIHVYDFDNTLFNSPLPNPKLWTGPTLGFLQTQDTFATGGWWHDARILGATGEGIEVEEPKAWKGWWNEQIAELIQLSMEQKDALTVLLTGRSENNFTDLLKRMLASKGLEFDMIALKPSVGPSKERLTSTMHFKQLFLESMVETYRTAEEIRIYEDRIPHTKKFREFFMAYNKRLISQGGVASRKPITAEVIQVAGGITQLDPVNEAAAVQRIINDHNTAVDSGTARKRLAIKKTVHYTGYLISKTDTEKLLTLLQLPPNMPDTEVKFLANNILITPRPAPESILEKVGGMGGKTTWQVTGVASYENKVWAVSVQVVPKGTKFYTENPTPVIVLALRKGTRPIDAGKIQNWQPVPLGKDYILETTVGEKMALRIEEELGDTEYESLFPNKDLKRKHEDSPSGRQTSGSYSHSRGGFQNNNNNNNSSRGGRGNRNGNNNNQRGGGGGRGRGGGGGGGGRGKGRGGGGHGYRSLDDVGERNSYNATPPSYNPTVAYEDFPPLQKNYQTPAQLVQQQFNNYNQYQQQMQSKNGKQGGSGELQYS